MHDFVLSTSVSDHSERTASLHFSTVESRPVDAGQDAGRAADVDVPCGTRVRPSRSASADVPARRAARKIRYTDAEWTTIVERAHACGRPPARYVREVSLGALPRSKRSHANAALVRELGRVGNTLAQLAAAARNDGTSSQSALDQESLERTLAEILAVVRRID